MHILFYTNWYIKLTLQLANALAREHRVTLILPDYSPEMGSVDSAVAPLKKFAHQNVELITLPHMQNLNLQWFDAVLKARKIIDDRQPDVIHFNESYDIRSYFLMKLCPHYTYFTTVHDPVAHFDEKISQQHFKHWIRDQIRHLSDGLIVYGEKLKQSLADFSKINPDQIFVVPHGQYTYYQNFRSSIKKDNQTKYILFFGRWEHYKGIDTLIDAEPLITARYPNIKIILAGEGRLPLSALDSHFVNRSQFDIRNYNLPDEEVGELFSLADIVVLPYREGTQSGPLHIAGSFGLPVVVTKVGSLPESVKDGETGLLIERDNPKALAEAVCDMLGDPQKAKRMGENAKLHMAATESAAKVAEIQTAAYRAVLATKSHHRNRLMGLMQSVVKKIKRDPDYGLDDSMLPVDLVAMFSKLGTSLIRGLWHRPRLKQARGFCFIGKRVKLRNRKHIQLGRNFIAEDDCEIQGASKEGVRFGDNVTVGSFSMIRPSGYYGRELGVGLQVGNRSNIGPFAYIGCSGGITIGDDVMMGPRVSLFAENHNFKSCDVTMRSQGVTRQSIVVEDDCWLASGSIILAGVKIGKGSIVAAGSIVTKDVPPYSIAAGSPAKVIKSRQAENIIDEKELAKVEAEVAELTDSDVIREYS